MILNKLKPYRILSLIFISVICAVSCSNDGLTEMNDPDIIVPNPITLTTRLIINEATGEGIRFEDRDSIYLIGSSRTAIYVNYSGAWISDNPLRWSEEETDSNNQYSFQCRFTGKTIGDTNQAPISLYAYSPGINKYESINLVFEHTEARVLIAVGLMDPSIVWNEHCEIYFNTIYTGISTSVNSKGEIVSHATGRKKDVMLTAFVDGDNKGFEFDYGCIGNIAPGQRIRSISIISNVDPDRDYTDVDPNDDDRKYFSVNLAKTDTDPFIPVSGNKNFLIIKLAPTEEEMEVVVNP